MLSRLVRARPRVVSTVVPSRLSRWMPFRSCASSSTSSPPSHTEVTEAAVGDISSRAQQEHSDSSVAGLATPQCDVEVRKNPELVEPFRRAKPSVHDAPKVVRPGELTDIATVIRNYWSTPAVGTFLFILILTYFHQSFFMSALGAFLNLSSKYLFLLLKFTM